jgi:hypothetical protein
MDQISNALELIQEIWPIGHQASRFDDVPNVVHRRQPRVQCHRIDIHPVSVCKRIDTDIKCLRSIFERLEGARDVLRPTYFRCNHLEAELLSCSRNLPHLQHNLGDADIA